MSASFDTHGLVLSSVLTGGGKALDVATVFI